MLFVEDIKRCIDRCFPPERASYFSPGMAGWQIVRKGDALFHQPLLECLECLKQIYGARLPELAAATYFNPVSWAAPMLESGHESYHKIIHVLNACVVLYPSDDVAARLEMRLVHILANPFERELVANYHGVSMPPERHYLEPDLEDCLGLLIGLPLTPNIVGLIERLLSGALDTGAFQLSPNDTAHTAYQLYRYRLSQPISELLRRLFQENQLPYSLFARCALYMPDIFDGLYQSGKFQSVLDYSLMVALDAHRQHLITDIIADLNSDNVQTLQKATYLHINDPVLRAQIPNGRHGAEYLVRAAEYHVRFGLGQLKLPAPYAVATLESTVSWLAQAGETATESERIDLVRQLQQFPAETLKALLPVALQSQQVIFEALGWTKIWKLEQLAQDILGQANAASEQDYGPDFPNSSDPLVGLIDIALIHSVVDELEVREIRDVFEAWHESQDGLAGALFLIEAVLGFNRQAVMQGFKRNKQLAIKALGALPLENGEAEVFERYLILRESEKMAQAKFGATRRLTHAAAVQTALMHLAQVAGYPDAETLEWDMESRIAQKTAGSGNTWQAGEYTITLILDGAEPDLLISRGGKTLKSVPASIRQCEAYNEAKNAVSQLRAQRQRLQKMLERLMISGEALPLERLVKIWELPIGREILACLILRLDNGLLGLIDRNQMMLSDVENRLHSVDSAVHVAHAYDLFHTGQLSAWQETIVHRHLVQPFRQAFRELYVITPAEEQTTLFSNRFAGHVLGANIAAKLFGSRGWRLTIRNGYQAFRHYGGIRAVFTFPGAHSFWGQEQVVTDQVYFERFPSYELIPLRDVPPLLFSETMRDADLFVSVAQREGDHTLSNESYEQRRVLVTTLLNEIGLEGVSVEGHFAHVQGKLAQYRVHLGSGVIHIEPGNYLCIVPSDWGRKHEKLFLPFADDADAKISEVISKILLLLSDAKITDETILRQIRAQR